MKTKKMLSKVLALLLAAIMVFAMSATVFAQTVDKDPKDADGATITIENAAKGVTYTVYQIFDATVNKDGGSIAYQLMTGKTDVPSTDFEKDSAGNVTAKDSLNLSNSNTIDTLKTYGLKVADVESDGSKLTFAGLAYGYYLVTTSQGNGAVTVTSTTPNATIYDKNSTTPVKDLVKEADGESYNVGDTIIYRVKFRTSNYIGADSDAKQVTKYVIKDTLPDFLEIAGDAVQSITIGGGKYEVNGSVPQFDSDGTIEIAWTDGDGTSLYDNGAEIVITYKAILKYEEGETAIDGDGNKNEVTVEPYMDNGNGGEEKDSNEYKTEDVIYTYALAIKKVDQSGNALAGAKFSVEGIQASGSDGVYVVTGATADQKTDTEMECDENGILILKGVKAGTYTVTETAAPSGYNKLTNTFYVTAVKTGKTTTSKTVYLDANGNITDSTTDTKKVTYTNETLSAAVEVVVNKTGSSLPSTGGIGTTIFYVIGGLLVAGAAVAMIVRKRMTGYND